MKHYFCIEHDFIVYLTKYFSEEMQILKTFMENIIGKKVKVNIVKKIIKTELIFF